MQCVLFFSLLRNEKIFEVSTFHELLGISEHTIFPACCCCCYCVTSVMSNSVQPYRWQPTRLPRPWDSPGKNTGAGCHCLLQCVKVKSLSRVRPSATPWTTAYQPPPSLGFSRQEYWSGMLLLSPFFSLGPTNLQDSVHLHNSPPASIWWEHWLGTSINPLPFGIIFPPRRLQEPCSGWCW